MSEIDIRIEGRAGRITLTRPKALNALTWEMIRAIDAALAGWEDDPAVALVIIDAEGDKAFCAGGDLAEMYRTAKAGDFDFGRRFWAEEYRLNARIDAYPKPYVALMQGYVMGGGVGVSCHGSHRVVCEGTKIAMPECAVGLVPDVGGSWLLSQAPGRLGEYLGMTGVRMGPGDAIGCGFADMFVPRAAWPALIEEMTLSGDPACLAEAARAPGPSPLLDTRPRIDRLFGLETAAGIAEAVSAEGWTEVIGPLHDNSPLSVACTLALIHTVRHLSGVPEALAMEYRFTSRAASDGDFIEGIRAAIIDKDRQPHWRLDSLAAVHEADVSAMLAPVADAPEFTD